MQKYKSLSGLFMKEDLKKLPGHLAIIIDGNGRWAKLRGLTRMMGHDAGFKNLKKITRECFYDYDIPIVSIYAFSTENWNRPEKEVNHLMNIFRKYLDGSFLKDYPDVSFNLMGDPNGLPKDIADKALDLMEKTKGRKYILNIGINYSGQDELVIAVNKIISEGIAKVGREEISNHLFTAGQPPVDLMIRTSGELRLSNFMLWQLAYAEFYFPKCHWPAFDSNELYNALFEYQSRDRRFGAIKE